MANGAKWLMVIGLMGASAGILYWQWDSVVPARRHMAPGATVSNSGGQGQPGRPRWNWGPPPPPDHLTDVPDLENQRETQLSATPAAPTVLDANFDCAAAPMATKISDTEFSLDYQHKDDGGGPNGVYWFMFKLDGVAGKTVRIDLKGIPLDKWHTLNPVYQYADGAVPAISEPLLPDDYNLKDAKLLDGHNGTRFPDTSGDPGGWHFIPDVWGTGGSAISFVQKFDKDEVTIAMRTPFTLEDEAALMEQARHDKAPPDMAAQVIDIGKTPEGRTLHVVKLSSGGEQGEKEHPCILMYAREHADEHDSSWAVAGALRWLLADGKKAQELRRRFTFLFIPVLDPDAAASSTHENIISTFSPDRFSVESLAYARWFKAWISKGDQLSAIVDFHNVESAEGSHLYVAAVPDEKDSLSTPTVGIYREMQSQITSHGFSSRGVDQRGTFDYRLGGWLKDTYDTISVLLEVNSQEPHQHLLAEETEFLGMGIFGASARFFDGSNSITSRYLSAQNVFRANYHLRWSTFGSSITTENPIVAEFAAASMAKRSTSK